jgi:hypothetical protein
MWMRTPDAIRAKRYRDRRRLGKVSVQVEVSEQDIELLQKRGYEVADKLSIGQAVSALLSDLVLEAA